MQQTKSNLIFLYGAPAGGKTFVAQQIAKATGFQYLNLDELLKNAKNDNDKTNLLIKHLKDKPDNYIIDNFLDTKAQVIVLFEHFQKPRYVVYLQSSKDEIEQNIRGLSTEEQKKTRLKRLQIFLQNRDDLLAYLKKQKFFVTVNGIQKGLSNNFEVSSKLIVQDVYKLFYIYVYYLSTPILIVLVVLLIKDQSQCETEDTIRDWVDFGVNVSFSLIFAISLNQYIQDFLIPLQESKKKHYIILIFIVIGTLVRLIYTYYKNVNANAEHDMKVNHPTQWYLFMRIRFLFLLFYIPLTDLIISGIIIYYFKPKHQVVYYDSQSDSLIIQIDIDELN